MPDSYPSKDLNLVGILCLQEGKQHAPHGMILEPLADLFDVFIVILAKFFEIDAVQMIFGFQPRADDPARGA